MESLPQDQEQLTGAGAKAPEKGQGEDMAKLIKIDKNGTKYYEGYKPCTRCDGKGVYIMGMCNNQPVLSPLDSGICWKCGGSKVEWGKWKEYTPEYEAKLEERRRKKLEKLQAEREAEEKRLEEERARIKAEEEAERKRIAELEAQNRAKSEYVGKIGEKAYISARYVGSPHYERPSFGGYGTEIAYIHTFKIGDNVLIWNTTSYKGLWDVEEGDTVDMNVTFKEHREYKGEKQTVLTRCKVVEVKKR